MSIKQSLIVAALVLLPAAAFALAPRATVNDPAWTAGGNDPAWTAGGKLDAAMQTLQAGQQKIGKALDKKELDTVLAQVVEMQKAAQEAKLETPATAGAVKEPDKKKEFVLGFRRQMIDLQHALLDLEAAVIEGKVDDAKKLFEERIKQVKKDAHAKYKGD